MILLKNTGHNEQSLEMKLQMWIPK